MSLSNSPDPAVREAVVRQDLGNVLHPIVQHKLLETKQMVVAGGEGSTIIDTDGTEYLDAMAGLWCVNIGYGRTELSEIAAEQTIRTQSTILGRGVRAPGRWIAQRDDMADLQTVLMNDDALDDELQDGLLVGEAGLVQAAVQARVERREISCHRLRLDPALA